MVVWVREGTSFFRPDRPLLCPLLRESVPISIYTDGQEIQSDQLAALSQFPDLPSDDRERLTRPLYEDYREVEEAVGEGPDIDGPNRVWEFVRWTSIIVPLQGTSGSRFVFVQGVPAWEEEHGVEMLFRDERLVRLDRASGAFLSDCFWAWS